MAALPIVSAGTVYLPLSTSNPVSDKRWKKELSVNALPNYPVAGD